MRRGRRAAGADHRAAEARGRRAVRRHHVETGQGRRSRTGRRPCAARAWSTARPSSACGSCSISTSACGRARRTPAIRSTSTTRIDIVVFRENTEDLYAGVEFNPVPDALADTLAAALAAVRALRRPEGRRVRGVVQDQHAEGLGAHHRRGVRLRAQARPQEGHRRAQGQRRARDRRHVPRDRPRGRRRATPRSSSTKPTSTR